jgi:hypothetical protein
LNSLSGVQISGVGGPAAWPQGASSTTSGPHVDSWEFSREAGVRRSARPGPRVLGSRRPHERMDVDASMGEGGGSTVVEPRMNLVICTSQARTSHTGHDCLKQTNSINITQR